MKKFLTALLIGAFVFGVGATNIQPVAAEAKKSNTPVADELQKKFENGEWKPFRSNQNGDNSNRPEPPKDENGNPLPPPDRNGDNSNRPEPPKDENGNPLPPPDNNGDNSNRPEPPKDENGNPLPPPDRNGDKSNAQR